MTKENEDPQLGRAHDVAEQKPPSLTAAVAKGTMMNEGTITALYDPLLDQDA